MSEAGGERARPPAPEDELLERLRAAASAADPVPEHVREGALAAGARATLDGELLDLCFDSLVDAAGADTRSPLGPRVLRFGPPGRTAELQVTGEGPVAVVGQLDPHGPDAVELVHAGGVLRGPVDALGRFVLPAVPTGPASLAWTASDGSRIRTASVCI